MLLPAPVQSGKSVGLPARKFSRMTTSETEMPPSALMSPHCRAPAPPQKLLDGRPLAACNRSSASPMVSRPSLFRSPQAEARADELQPATTTIASSPASMAFHVLLVLIVISFIVPFAFMACGDRDMSGRLRDRDGAGHAVDGLAEMIDRVGDGAGLSRELVLALAGIAERAASGRAARRTIARADRLGGEVAGLAHRRIEDVGAAEGAVVAIAELRAGLAGGDGDRRPAVV